MACIDTHTHTHTQNVPLIFKVPLPTLGNMTSEIIRNQFMLEIQLNTTHTSSVRINEMQLKIQCEIKADNIIIKEI